MGTGTEGKGLCVPVNSKTVPPVPAPFSLSSQPFQLDRGGLSIYVPQMHLRAGIYLALFKMAVMD